MITGSVSFVVVPLGAPKPYKNLWVFHMFGPEPYKNQLVFDIFTIHCILPAHFSYNNCVFLTCLCFALCLLGVFIGEAR